MAPKHVHAWLRGRKLFQLQQAKQGRSQTKERCQQDEDEALMDAMELIDEIEVSFSIYDHAIDE